MIVQDRGLILRFVESRMGALAPNLSAIVGSHIAAQVDKFSRSVYVRVSAAASFCDSCTLRSGQD